LSLYFLPTKVPTEKESKEIKNTKTNFTTVSVFELISFLHLLASLDRGALIKDKVIPLTLKICYLWG
jgi:hypothetical protein